MNTLRIFISSPGDVAEERDKAKQVIAALERHYGGQITLVPVLWEDLAIPATASFQEGIDLVLADQQRIDIAVFILWSRLGSPLGAVITKPDGSPYRSGTEREFDLMLAAFEQSGRRMPIILAYTRDDTDGFNDRLDARTRDEDALEELLRQRRLVKQFIQERFHDEQGRNLRAYHTYREPVGFAQRLHVHLRGAVDELLGLDHASAPWSEAPYRSLEVFDIRHAPIFCGRDEETCELLQRLRDQQAAGCAFVGIVGASGSGKSSLARAGVAATLIQRSFDDGVKEWRAAAFIPGHAQGDLFLALARTLAEPLPALREGPGGLEKLAHCFAEQNHEAAGILLETAFTAARIALGVPRPTDARGGSLRVLLVLDQMEELWTDRGIAPEQREKFLHSIEALARLGPLSVLGTLRSDFYPQAQLAPAFLRMKGERGHFDLTPPGAAALQQLIVQPALRAGLSFERDVRTGRTLDQRILEEAARDPSALPLLQYALAELYERRDEPQHRLTFAAYEAMGGVEGALGQRAEQTFHQLPADAQAALEEVLPLLISVDIAGEQNAVRRRAPLAELTSTPARRALTERLTRARFVTTDDQGGTPIAALAHEALLRRSARLAGWINTNRDLLRMRARLEQYHAMWEDSGRDTSRLLPAGLPLEEGRQLLATPTRMLDEKGKQFVLTSAADHEAQQRRARQRRRVAFTALSALSVLAIAGMSLALLAYRQSSHNYSQVLIKEHEQRALLEEAARSDRLVAAEKIASGKPAEAFAHYARAARYTPRSPVNALAALPLIIGTDLQHTLVRFEGHTNSIVSAVFSPDGRRILTASDDKTARLWEVDSGKELARFVGHAEALTSAVFSPDGRRVLTASKDNTARLWEAESGKELARFVGHPGPIWSAVFSPDGRRVLTASGDETARLWEAESGKELARFVGHSEAVLSAVFSSDGRRILTASDDNTARLWAADSSKELTRFVGHTDSVLSAVFSPDGRRILTACKDKTARLWETESGKELARFVGHTDSVLSAVFSPDARKVLTASDDNTARLWAAESGKELAAFEGHTEAVLSAVFSPDGRRILTASWDKTARLWEASGKELARFEHFYFPTSAVFSLDGRKILTASVDNTARLWDADNGKEFAHFIGHTDFVTSAVFSADGRKVLTASWDRTVRLWETDSGKELARFLGHFGHVTSAVFSPDGRRILTASDDMTARLWDADSGKELTRFEGHSNTVTSAVFSPDGRRILTDAWDKTVRLWETDSGKELARFEGHSASVGSAVFSADGRRILIASDLIARLCETDSGKELARFEGHTDAVASAVFSPDGRRILTASKDHTAQLWEADSGKKLTRFEGHTDFVTSAVFSPDGRRVLTASQDKTVRLWETESGKELARFEGHSGSVLSAVFSPDGRRILTASWDKTARLWPVLPSGDPPDWLTEFLTWLGGARLEDDNGQFTLLSDPERRELEHRLSQNIGEPADYARLLHWRLTPARERLIDPYGTVSRAQAAAAIGERGGALNAMNYAYALDPQNPLIHLRLASFEEDPASAEFLRHYSLSRLPSDLPLLAAAATILGQQNDHLQALNTADRALALDARNLPGLRVRAAALNGLDRSAEALAAYRAVLEAGGQEPGDFIAASYFAAKLGRAADVDFFIEAGQKAHPKSANIALIEGWARINLGAFPAALVAFRRAETLLPAGEERSDAFLAGLALSLWLNNERDAAVSSYEKLLEADFDWSTPEKITSKGWSDMETKPMEALRAETLRRHPELAPKNDGL